MMETNILRKRQAGKDYRTITIPPCRNHSGLFPLRINVLWECPTCGKPRGEIVTAFSYDGSRRLVVDGWKNDCGHIDYYETVRETEVRYK